MSSENILGEPLRSFARTVTEKSTQLTRGEPENQLRGPFETFMGSAAKALGVKIVCTGETPLPGRLGRPDYAIHLARLVVGYVELKAPGVGATASRFKGHNKKQFQRFSAIPNIMYTDGNEWAIYRDGKLMGKIVRLPRDVATDGDDAADDESEKAIEKLLRDFFNWNPVLPTDRKGKIDLEAYAALLAPLCRLLREDVADALKDQNSPLVQLAMDWRQLLFPDASNEQFADAYAQTVTFALLLGRSEGADPLTLDSAEMALAVQHNLLSRALQVLTDPGARAEMTVSVDLLLRVIGAVPPSAFTGPEDPWLYFYEDFLAEYDPKLRKNAGAYYTPIEVVRCQVRLIDDLLVNRLNKQYGFADSSVVTLDPASGTGTYLLGIIHHALDRVKAEQGAGAVAGQATMLANNLFGFELMVGPYAVTELRVSRALRDRGASLPEDGTHVYLTDTLESPHAEPPQLPLFLRPIAEQHAKALKVKNDVPVIVCLGNPPYDRHEAATIDNKARTGGWIRWGDEGDGSGAILCDFLNPATAAGHGVHVKNLYNLYVYFWRWALWKVFEHPASHGPGVVSFISASSYIDGNAFCGMREHMRRQCDEVWILDLGGEGRGTRKDDNVFAIQTPVAIAFAVRADKAKTDKPAKVHYARIEGIRNSKLRALDSITSFSQVKWQDCPVDWQAPFRPAGKGDYFAWPLLTDLMPWQQSGVKAGRTWVISPNEIVLNECWHALLRAKGGERKKLFKDSPTGRKVHESAKQLPPFQNWLKAIAELSEETPPPNTTRFAYRSFDRQFIIADARVLDRPGPSLWSAHSEHQVYLTTLLNHPLGHGPAATATALIPDLHHFRGSYGAKEVFPLYRTADALESNILPDLLELIEKEFKHSVTPLDMFAYVYCILAQPSFTARYHKELGTRELRVPITKDATLFGEIRNLGAKLLWLHTYGKRFVPQCNQQGSVPRGSARCTEAIPDNPSSYPEDFEYLEDSKTLRVGEGTFTPVSQEVYSFEVSGLKVVQSWLKYRMKLGAGKKSSPLDNIRPERWTSQFTTELLELLWVLEMTLASYPEQIALFEAVIEGECFAANELPPVPDEMRKPPHKGSEEGTLFD